MGKPYFDFYTGEKVFRCTKCKTHFGGAENILSKNFHSKTGPAYLFNQFFNYYVGKAEDREMLTGLHTVCDVYCLGCHKEIGLKYIDAFEESDKYKIGKVIVKKYYFEEVRI